MGSVKYNQMNDILLINFVRAYVIVKYFDPEIHIKYFNFLAYKFPIPQSFLLMTFVEITNPDFLPE